MFLLDTNVVSELRRTRPHGAVVAWLHSAPKGSLRICALTLGEIQRGVEITRTRDPAKARAIEIWADKVEQSFSVISVDAAVFRRHAKLMQGRSSGIYEDALIAATALVHELVVITRDVADFKGFGVRAIDPFGFRGD
ncbi:MAG: type II toxin-antitoxin system VapC family toxin [Roseiarcus sp.]